METKRRSEPIETAVTGKPLSDYEPYVDLIAQVMANGLALAADREFLASLDLSLPLHEACETHARESIRWRFAFHIDDIDNVRRAAEDVARTRKET